MPTWPRISHSLISSSTWYSGPRTSPSSESSSESRKGETRGVSTDSSSGLVKDIAQKDKNEAKQTKPSTGMERAQEIKAEGKYVLNGPIRTHFNGPGINDPKITMEQYIRLEEEKARRRGKVYNWETATYGKIWYDEDVHNLISVETEFQAIVYNDALTSEVALS
ncbi:hypothetical protein Tco_0978726, partial [Tanacetum coccineum]